MPGKANPAGAGRQTLCRPAGACLAYSAGTFSGSASGSR
jgi:hypothetical protein